MNPSPVAPPGGQAITVRRGDRWTICHRLQELNIPAACPADGTLRVEVNHALALLLVCSTLRQFALSRPEQVDWLERCWRVPASGPRD
ncbi:MAG TPA: hypothetical protein IGR64_14830 [Leptolyngbyaceae cyanobacterium M65_K2018_010]|nr:hypothetical protein [Leptolyngbyaceae cyanobacterium M65_K2018_010]